MSNLQKDKEETQLTFSELKIREKLVNVVYRNRIPLAKESPRGGNNRGGNKGIYGI